MAEIGATLREARMRARIDINEVELRTKIRAKYLRAMENEEWDLLPGDVYVKSFLRTYADFLGLDSRQLLDDYRRRYEHPSDHDQRPLTPLSRDRDRRGARQGAGRPSVPPWAMVLVAVVAIFAVLEVIGLGGGSQTTSTTVISSSSLSATGGQRHRRRSHRTSSPAGTTGAAHRAASVRLQLVPTGAVYVCLLDGSGRRLIPGVIYGSGQAIPIERAQKLLLTLGNASVTMKVDGAPIAVPSTGRPVGFQITPGSTVQLPASKQPQCP